MDIENSYVVRIYRRLPPGGKPGSHDDPVRLIGVVENPATGHRQAFHDIGELWAVLAASDSPVSARKRKPAPVET